MEHYRHVVSELLLILFAESQPRFRYVSGYGNYFPFGLRAVLRK
jgi:hypothetical protein